MTETTEKLPGAEKKLVAGICGILLGPLGVHRFILGDPVGGVIRFVIAGMTCGVGGVIGLIEGIIYLTRSDEQFVETYINEPRKNWF